MLIISHNCRPSQDQEINWKRCSVSKVPLVTKIKWQVITILNVAIYYTAVSLVSLHPDAFVTAFPYCCQIGNPPKCCFSSPGIWSVTKVYSLSTVMRTHSQDIRHKSCYRCFNGISCTITRIVQTAEATAGEAVHSTVTGKRKWLFINGCE